MAFGIGKIARPTLAERIHERFYKWYGRRYPDDRAIVSAVAHSRRDMRDAYEAGFKAGRKQRDGDKHGS